MNMLNSLSRNQQLPQIAPRYGCLDPLPGRLPFQGYNSPCSGRHYCLRGMDYHASGVPGTERSLRPLCAEQPTVRFAGTRPLPPGSAPKTPCLPRPSGVHALHPAPFLCACLQPCSVDLRGRLYAVVLKPQSAN